MNSQTDSSLRDYGRDIFYAAFNSGLPIAPVFQKAADQYTAGAPDPLAGMLSAGLAVIDQFCKQGHAFGDGGDQLSDPHDVAITLTNQMHQRDHAGIGRTLSVLSAGIECVRSTLPAGSTVGLKVDAPQPVYVVNLPAPTTQQVQVVSLPARQTTTEVARDSKGNIVSAAQVERDLAAA